MINSLLLLFSTIFSRTVFYRLGLIVRHLGLRMMGIGNYENFSISGEKYILKKILKSYERTNMVIFDVGSHHGTYAKKVLEYFPNAAIHCFEPLKSSYKKLSENLASQPNVFLNNVAVSDKSGNLKMWDYSSEKGSQHASMHKTMLLDENKRRQLVAYSVPSTTLTTYLKKHDVSDIDLLKIDVEGSEYQVLVGMKDQLSSVSVIQFEFNYMACYSGYMFKDFFDLLNPDFHLFRLYQDGLLPIVNYSPTEHEIFFFQNIVAINRNSKLAQLHTD